MRRNSATPAGPSGQTSRRMFFFTVSSSTASSSKAGATSTSVKMSATCRAISAVTGRLVAITPPYADSGSQACALRCASAMSAPTAMPHGLACLMIATHGSAKSYAARRAASAST